MPHFVQFLHHRIQRFVEMVGVIIDHSRGRLAAGWHRHNHKSRDVFATLIFRREREESCERIAAVSLK